MLPTVAKTEPERTYVGVSVSGRRVPRVLSDLDELLFVRGGWFALDGENQRVAGVVVSSLRDGLRLVGQGPVTAIVGRLRPELRVVDVDLEGPRGDAVVEMIAGWCRGKDVWHLVRPSGGADGRAHVFVAVHDQLDAFEGFVGGIRQKLRASRRGIDVRDTVRPLSSPHRSGVVTKPYGSLPEALLGLRGHSWAAVAPKRRQKRSGARVSAVPASPIRRRGRKDLPPAWQDYLEHAALPLIRVDDPAQPRSNFEATATAVLLRCGYDAAAAWQLIEGAHPDAFSKARSQGRSWWVKYVWNKAVADDDTFIPVGAGQLDPEVAAAVHVARAALEDLAWRVPVRQRPALLLVGHAVLDRMCRANARRVPVPERDLVLDTGLSDRKTIRAQLRLLHGPLGTLHTEVWDPVHKRDSSSFEFELPLVRGVSEIPPPSLHTPLPKGTWAALPRPSHQLWRALRTSTEPVSIEELAVHAHLTDTRTTPATASQIRAARSALLALSEAGLASCSADGTWQATGRPERSFVEQARHEHEAREEAVTEERALYRSGSSSQWSIARAAALKAQKAREVAWWDGLTPEQRERRREVLRDDFLAGSVLTQEQLKACWADRRRRHGIEEPDRYQAWLDGMSDEELAFRSTSRAGAFARLATPLQQALVASWTRHRDRYGLPQRPAVLSVRVEHHLALPVGADERDRDFWRQESFDVRRAHDMLRLDA